VCARQREQQRHAHGWIGGRRECVLENGDRLEPARAAVQVVHEVERERRARRCEREGLRVRAIGLVGPV
jgi:hypothetical protein